MATKNERMPQKPRSAFSCGPQTSSQVNMPKHQMMQANRAMRLNFQVGLYSSSVIDQLKVWFVME